MIWGLALYPTVIGYLFLRRWNYTRFEIPHDTGYHVLFKSIIAGMILFPIPYVIATIFSQCFSSFSPFVVWKTLVPFDYVGTLAIVTFEALVIAWLLNGTRWFSEFTCLRRTIRNRGDLIGNLMVDIAVAQKFVEISLKNRKSYIGVPIYWNNAAGKHIELIPYWSGYRHEDTQRHTITTHYSPTVREHRRECSPLSSEEIRLVIPSAEIVSARPFIYSLYKEFQQRTQPT